MARSEYQICRYMAKYYTQKDAPADADDFLKQTDKFDKFFSEAPGEGD